MAAYSVVELTYALSRVLEVGWRFGRHLLPAGHCLESASGRSGQSGVAAWVVGHTSFVPSHVVLEAGKMAVLEGSPDVIGVDEVGSGSFEVGQVCWTGDERCLVMVDWVLVEQVHDWRHVQKERAPRRVEEVEQLHIR